MSPRASTLSRGNWTDPSRFPRETDPPARGLDLQPKPPRFLEKQTDGTLQDLRSLGHSRRVGLAYGSTHPTQTSRTNLLNHRDPWKNKPTAGKTNPPLEKQTHRWKNKPTAGKTNPPFPPSPGKNEPTAPFRSTKTKANFSRRIALEHVVLLDKIVAQGRPLTVFLRRFPRIGFPGKPTHRLARPRPSADDARVSVFEPSREPSAYP